MIKHFVEYLHPGMIISDTSSVEINHRDPSKIILAKFSFGFRFYDREIMEKEGSVLKSDPMNYSNWYYEGEKYDKNDVKNKVENNETLLKNMEYNNIKYVVKTKHGQFIPLEKDDKTI